MSDFLNIWNESQLAGANPPAPFNIPNTPGCSIKLTNNSIYYLNLMKTATGTHVDVIPPFSFLIFPNQPDLSLSVDPARTPSTNVPDTQEVTFSTMSGNVQYQHGSTTFNGQQNVNVAGDLNANITNSTLSVDVQGTPEFTLAQGASVAIEGTAQVAISGTPKVELAGTSNVNILNTPEVAITGTPSVNLAPGTAVEIANTPSVYLADSTVNIGNTPEVSLASGAKVSIEGTQQVNVTNQTLSVANDPTTPLTVAGQINISNTPNVNVAGTPTVNIADGQSIAIAGTPSVAIEGTPEVTFAAGASVEIANTPEVTFASGSSVAIEGTPEVAFAPGTSVGIDINANQIEIINQPGVTIENENVKTDIGFGMTRDIGGGVFFADSAGITIVAFAELVQQIYLQNRGSADVYVTGDEDPSMSSQGVLLSSGDAIGLSWRTKNIYMKAAASQIPVQAQGFY